MTREQMTDQAVRKVFVRPGMKRPLQILKAVSNRAALAEAFHRDEPNDGRPPWSCRWYRPVGHTGTAAIISDLETRSVADFALRARDGESNCRGIAWVAYWFRQFANAA